MRRLLTLFFLLAAWPTLAAVETTTVTGKLYDPSGTAVTAGTLVCELSQAGTTLDGTANVRVATRKSATISATGVSIALVPNDAITPTGTTYKCKHTVTAPVSAYWTETWSVATAVDPIDIGSVTRPDVPAALGPANPSNCAAGQAAAGIDGNGAAEGCFTPGGVETSAVSLMYAHAALYGDPEYYTRAAVFDLWLEVFDAFPLRSDTDNNGTAGSSSGQTVRAATSQCYDTSAPIDCSGDISAICITTSDAASNGVADTNADGTPDFTAGDVVFLGTNANTGAQARSRSHVISSIANGTGTGCPAGTDNQINVYPFVDQNTEGPDFDGDNTMDAAYLHSVWINDTHPTNAGAHLIGRRLGYASRLRHGAQGPNLLFNGSMDYDTAVDGWTTSADSLSGDSFNSDPGASPGGVNWECSEGGTNACVYFSSTTAGAYVQSTDWMTTTPGETYVLTLAPILRSGDVVAIMGDADNDGTEDVACSLTSNGALYSYLGNQHASWLHLSCEIPEGVHRVKVRVTKGDTAGSLPLLDAASFRRVTTRYADTSSGDENALTSFLINDPGTRNIVITGDSWATSTGYGQYIAAGLGDALEARFGRNIDSQIIATGVGGYTIASVIANLDTLLGSYVPLYVVYSVGVNDAAGSTSTADFVAGCRQLEAMTRARGAIPIFLGVPPIGPAGAVSNYADAHTLRDAQRRALLNEVP